MTDQNPYTHDEHEQMLTLARRTLTLITARQAPPKIDLATVSPRLTEERACFVTLRRRIDGGLRGCTGTLVARRPLIEEVVYMTEQTAFHDPRFEPVVAAEVGALHIEISILTPPQQITFDSPEELLARLRPGIDGVTLQLDTRRATFLPQVWESYPDPQVFLSLLSQKMGHRSDAWRDPDLLVHTYQALVIEEEF